MAINSTGASALGALAIATIGLWLNTEFGNVMAIGGITSALLVGLHALTRDQAVAELPPEPTAAELAAAFRRAPGDCFFQYDGEHYGWPKEIRDSGFDCVRTPKRPMAFFAGLCG